MPMHEGEEPVLAIEGGAQWFIREVLEGEKLKSIPEEYIRAGLYSFETWWGKNERREWEALGNMMREEQYGCVLMEIALNITKAEEDESNRGKYYAILKEVLNDSELLGDSEVLQTDEGYSDLWLVLTEPRVSSLDHLKTFRVFGRRVFKQALKQSAGKKKLWATMFVLMNQYGQAKGYFTDKDSVVNEVQSYKKLRGRKLTEKKGKYTIEEQVIDPLSGKVKTSKVISRHVVR